MTNPTPDALMPCAHCGSAAQHYHRSDTTGWSNTDWVSCSDDDCGVSTALEETKAEAITIWNRRAGQAHERRAAGLLAALEEAHETMHQCTAVLTANDCAKVAAVMERCRAAIAAAKGGRNAG